MDAVPMSQWPLARRRRRSGGCRTPRGFHETNWKQNDKRIQNLAVCILQEGFFPSELLKAMFKAGRPHGLRLTAETLSKRAIRWKLVT